MVTAFYPHHGDHSNRFAPPLATLLGGMTRAVNGLAGVRHSVRFSYSIAFFVGWGLTGVVHRLDKHFAYRTA